MQETTCTWIVQEQIYFDDTQGEKQSARMMLQATSGRRGFGYVNDKGINKDLLRFSRLIHHRF